MNDTPPLIPVRMVNEYVYCQRLAYMMWVQGEFAHNADTVEGTIRHKRVDKPGGRQLETAGENTGPIHARSVALSSENLGITAKIDLVEGSGVEVFPVDYKKGKRPHVAAGAYLPERVQVCAQALLLREHGFTVKTGILYFVASRERVKVVLDEDLIAETMRAIQGLRAASLEDHPPPPLEDSPKCARCSLLGICLPDEMGFLTSQREDIRPIYARKEYAFPLYVQSSANYIRKDGGQLIIEEKREKVAEVCLKDISQVVLFGHCGMSTPTLHECFRRQLPVTYMSYGGWFMGHTTGTGHHNVQTRTAQYKASFIEQHCLNLASSFVQTKIQNCRTLLRRNWKPSEGSGDKAPQKLLAALQNDRQQIAHIDSLQQLLGIEGNAASRYFKHFMYMISPEKKPERDAFDFSGRNRRPPKDPINALLSFGYAMLVREWTVVLSAVGLDPYRGFYHQIRFGRPGLSLDMMEPFRPLVVDSTVITVINNGEIKMQDFVITPFGCNLTPKGRKIFIAAFERRLSQEITHPVFGYRLTYRRLFEVQSRLLIRYLTGEINAYPSFVTR